MIRFNLPQLSMSLSEYMEIVRLQTEAGSCVGFCIALGKEFFSTGIGEVDNDLLPMITSKVGENVNPRVVPSYAMLLWFTLKVCIDILYSKSMCIHNTDVAVCRIALLHT